MEHLTKQTFFDKVFNYEKNQDWKFEGELPCIIDFYADWCQPCKIVAPILEELAGEYEGKINIYKIMFSIQELHNNYMLQHYKNMPLPTIGKLMS